MSFSSQTATIPMNNTGVIIKAFCLGVFMIGCFISIKKTYVWTNEAVTARYAAQPIIYHACPDQTNNNNNNNRTTTTVVEITRYKEKPRLIHYSTEESQPLGPDIPFDGFYTHAKFHTWSGANAIAATNVCFKFESGSWKTLFFHPPGKPILNQTDYDYMKTVRSDYTFLHGFKFKWDLSNVEGPIPDDYVIIQGVTNVVQPGWIRHIGHWDEAVLGLWHLLLYPYYFPWTAHMNRLLILHAPEDDIAYNKEILNIILSAMPPEQRKKLTFDYGDRREAQKFCLEKAMLVGWSIHERWGGFFASPDEADMFREAAWKYYNITPKPLPERLDKVSVFLIDRGQGGNGGRRLTNQQEVATYIKTTHSSWAELHPHSGPFQLGSPRDQIQWMSETDILVGAHGSGLFNSMFLRRHSVVIDLTPGTIQELCFHDCAVSSGHTYFFDIPPDNSKMQGWTNSSWKQECNTHELYDNWLDEGCHAPWGYNFEANTKRLGALLQQGRFHITHVKRLKPKILY